MSGLTVAQFRALMARLIGIPASSVGHYAAVVETADGLVVEFCCEDRRATAHLLRTGADSMLSQVGLTMNDRPPPPMPES